jgi:tripartite-type tricarboxylate transporter receptor subunit TctC
MKRAMAGLAALAAASAAMPAAAQDDFFAGKTMTYIVTTDPGGGYDTYGRLIARYLEKHLGLDRVLVRNMPGAGHIVGTNFLYAAEPDGLTIGTFNTGLVYAQLLGLEGVQFDLAEMSWIGKAANETRSLVIGAETPYKSIEDVLGAAEPIKLAAAGVGSAAYNETLLVAEALDLNIEVIPGFSGTEGEMSILRGEVAGTLGSKSSLQPFVDAGSGFFALDIGGTPDPAIPQARDLVKDDEGRSIIAVIESQATLSRLTAGPPGIPADRLERLREAYAAALSDPALLAEAETMGIPIEPLIGEDVARAIDAALHQPPETVALFASVMNAEVPAVTVEAAINEVMDEGRQVAIDSGGQAVNIAISGSRTALTIDGAEGDRENLVAGMTCTITYAPGGENEASKMDCRN